MAQTFVGDKTMAIFAARQWRRRCSPVPVPARLRTWKYPCWTWCCRLYSQKVLRRFRSSQKTASKRTPQPMIPCRRLLRTWPSYFKTTGKDQTHNDGKPALAIPQIRRLISWSRWTRPSFRSGSWLSQFIWWRTVTDAGKDDVIWRKIRCLGSAVKNV